jgi:ribosomal protein L7/L12
MEFNKNDTFTKIGAIKFVRFALDGAVGLVDAKRLVESLPEPYELGDLQNLIADFRSDKLRKIDDVWYRVVAIG